MKNQRLLDRIDALKRALAEAPGDEEGSFNRVFHEFFDIADDPALLHDSEPAKDPEIREAIERAARKLTGDPKATLQGFQAIEYPGSGLRHGGFRAGRFLGTFFYFAQEKQGLVAFNAGGEMTNFLRITVTPLPEGTTLMKKPPGVQ
jgi:hypothetical protein